MMRKNEFFDYVRNNVKDYLPEKFADADIQLQEVTKRNGQTLTAIVIPIEGSNITPNIYLDSFYQEYLEGKNSDACVGDLADFWMEKMEPDLSVDMDAFLNYENAKEKLQVRICDAEVNKEWLEGIAYTLHGDFAAYYTINLQESADGIASSTVTKQLLDNWKIDLNQLHQDAMEADLKRIPVLSSMDDMLASMIYGNSEPENLLGQPVDASAFEQPMFCLTNAGKINGAGLLINEDIRRQLADFMKCDFYILPSSVHEVLIVPADGSLNLQELNSMVKEINETQVALEDRLSDKVQFCDEKTAVMENAQMHEEKLRRKNLETKSEKSEKGRLRGKLEKAKEEVKIGEVTGKSQKKVKDTSLAM